MGVGLAAQELLQHAALYKHCASSILLKMPTKLGESALLYSLLKSVLCVIVSIQEVHSLTDILFP